MSNAVDKLLAIANAEVGYLEKGSLDRLDDPTANAGGRNYTKYARDLDRLGCYNGKKQGYAWCDVFADWCFVKAFGLGVAWKMTGQAMGGCGAGCTQSAAYYKAMGRLYTANPQRGDQIFFTNDNGKTFCHTGIVTAVTGGRVYTIEGNTSGGSTVIANGGGVCAKSYALTYSKIGGYGRPKWELAPDEATKNEEEECNVTNEEVKKLVQEAVAAAQKDQTIYNRVEELPEWYRPAIQALIDAGHLKGDQNGNLNLTDTMARMLVVTARAGGVV